MDHRDPHSWGAAQTSMLKLSWLNHSNHALKATENMISEFHHLIYSTHTYTFLAFSRLKCSTDCKGKKWPCSCLRGVLPALQGAAQLAACSLLTWASSLQSIMTDYRLLPEEPWKDGSSLGGNAETESLQQPDTQGPHHPSNLTRTAHFAVVTWQSPWRLGQWNIRDFVWPFFSAFVSPFLLSVCLSFGAQGHWEMSKSSVSVLSELLMRHLWLSSKLTSKLAKTNGGPQLGGLCSYVLPFYAHI